jgi:ABC-type branched-subunit amino acid transport system permease subunit
MNNTENDSNRRQEIQSSLNSIVESSDKWLERLRRREFRVRLAGSFLTGSLVLMAVGAVAILGFYLSQGEEIDDFFEQQSLVFQFSLLGAAAAAGLISGILTYFFLKRKHDTRMKDLSSLITEMKKKTNEQQQNNANVVGGGEGITKEALSLAEKIVTLLPELVRKRKHDSLLFGAVAFIVTNVVVSNLVVAIIVGVLVWLYVRHRTKKSYEHEMSKYEEQKRVFEQRKRDFIDTL